MDLVNPFRLVFGIIVKSLGIEHCDELHDQHLPLFWLDTTNLSSGFAYPCSFGPPSLTGKHVAFCKDPCQAPSFHPPHQCTNEADSCTSIG
jgi:hypothetical protein